MKQRAQTLQRKMQDADLYLKGACNKIARTSVEVEKTKLLSLLRARFQLITLWVIAVIVAFYVSDMTRDRYLANKHYYTSCKYCFSEHFSNNITSPRKQIQFNHLRLVIYEFFSCSTNIRRGLSAYKPQKLVVYCFYIIIQKTRDFSMSLPAQ